MLYFLFNKNVKRQKVNKGHLEKLFNGLKIIHDVFSFSNLHIGNHKYKYIRKIHSTVICEILE